MKQIYFYDAIKNSQKEPQAYANQQKFHENLKMVSDKLRIRSRKLKYLVELDERKITEAGEAVGIVDSCKYKLKKFLYKLGLIKITKEKGVDILLVTDAVQVAQKKEASTIVLLSGDADFVPLINLLRSYGILCVNLHLYKGSANELRIACDEHILIYFDENGLNLKY